ncbi:MAG: hypothetical protein ACREOI_36610 [bacterium]
MDLQNVLKASKDFYKSHQLEAWAKALPNSIKLNKEAESAIARAEELGLEQAMAFPDFKTQMAAIATVIAETAMQPVPGIPANPKFAKVYISDDWAKEPSGRVYQARRGLDLREKGPYLLFYNLQNIPKQTVGKKGDQIAKLFTSEGWSGFTAPELLIAQRFWRESAAAKGIDAKSKDLGKFYWVWVVDSGDKQNCSAAFYGLQGVGMYGCKIGSANKQRGANVTVVVPL